MKKAEPVPNHLATQQVRLSLYFSKVEFLTKALIYIKKERAEKAWIFDEA